MKYMLVYQCNTMEWAVIAQEKRPKQAIKCSYMRLQDALKAAKKLQNGK